MADSSAMHLDVRGSRAARLCLVAVLGGAALAACSSGSSKPAEKLAPEDTANATLTLAGDAPMAGKIADPIVNCSFPTLDGLRITTSGQPLCASDANNRSMRSGRRQFSLCKHACPTAPCHK